MGAYIIRTWIKKYLLNLDMCSQTHLKPPVGKNLLKIALREVHTVHKTERNKKYMAR